MGNTKGPFESFKEGWEEGGRARQAVCILGQLSRGLQDFFFPTQRFAGTFRKIPQLSYPSAANPGPGACQATAPLINTPGP